MGDHYIIATDFFKIRTFQNVICWQYVLQSILFKYMVEILYCFQTCCSVASLSTLCAYKSVVVKTQIWSLYASYTVFVRPVCKAKLLG